MLRGWVACSGTGHVGGSWGLLWSLGLGLMGLCISRFALDGYTQIK